MVSNLVVEIAIYNFDLFHYTLLNMGSLRMTSKGLTDTDTLHIPYNKCGTTFFLLSFLNPAKTKFFCDPPVWEISLTMSFIIACPGREETF